MGKNRFVGVGRGGAGLWGRTGRKDWLTVPVEETIGRVLYLLVQSIQPFERDNSALDIDGVGKIW